MAVITPTSLRKRVLYREGIKRERILERSLYKKAAIVGVYDYPERRALGKTASQVQAECALKALEDAGLTLKDVDGLCVAAGNIGPEPMSFAEYLGIYPTYFDTTMIGGPSPILHTIHAMTAIAMGLAKVVLVAYAKLPLSEGRRTMARAGLAAPAIGGGEPPGDNYETPYGLTLISTYALCAQRHMTQYGTTPEQLAEVAVIMRRHAAFNPFARFRDPITVQDVLNSRMVADPLHLLDCCVITDGGGAIVVTTPEIALHCKKKPVWLLGAGEAQMHTSSGHRDYTVSAAKQSGPAAFEMAGITHEDIDLMMIYDAFTINVIITLEDLGFCRKGEGGPFVQSGRIALGGKLPVNTYGGGLSNNHTGMRGVFLLVEAVRQLRNEFAGTPRQVDNCRIAGVHGVGGMMGTRHSGVTCFLTND